MPSFWRHVNEVIRESDVILHVLDARLPDETRNLELEEKVLRAGKKLLFVLTKCDLTENKKFAIKPSIFVSAIKHFGITILKKKILAIAGGKAVVVGVVGYPNVGKSSLINALAGRGKAGTSSQSGYTRGVQKIRVDTRIMLLDTPGVLPWKEKNVNKHAKIGAVDYGKIKDPQAAVEQLIDEERDLICKFYQVSGDDLIEAIAAKKKLLLKGGVADIDRAARMILKDWQTGKINQ